MILINLGELDTSNPYQCVKLEEYYIYSTKISCSALQDHRNQLIDQVKAYENLNTANKNREVQLDRYRSALETKNEESANVLNTFKSQIIVMKKGQFN